MSELKASGELLRIERDSASARVYRLEEEQRKRNDARKAETDETVCLCISRFHWDRKKRERGRNEFGRPSFSGF